MPFSALIDDTPVRLIGPDSDETWERAQEVKREGRIRCRGCGGEMRTRQGANIERHFFHKAAPDSCLLGIGEGKKHLRAKLGIAEAIEASGGEALVEHIAIDRSFVVDVLGVWNESGRQHRVAFEVQVSSQIEDVTAQRTPNARPNATLRFGCCSVTHRLKDGQSKALGYRAGATCGPRRGRTCESTMP